MVELGDYFMVTASYQSQVFLMRDHITTATSNRINRYHPVRSRIQYGFSENTPILKDYKRWDFPIYNSGGNQLVHNRYINQQNVQFHPAQKYQTQQQYYQEQYQQLYRQQEVIHNQQMLKSDSTGEVKEYSSGSMNLITSYVDYYLSAIRRIYSNNSRQSFFYTKV